MKANADALVRDLSLALMYLTSWEEDPVVWEDEPVRMRRCWKGFRFEVLDERAEQGMIRDSKRAKSVTLSEAGGRRAREVLARYSIDHALA